MADLESVCSDLEDATDGLVVAGGDFADGVVGGAVDGALVAVSVENAVCVGGETLARVGEVSAIDEDLVGGREGEIRRAETGEPDRVSGLFRHVVELVDRGEAACASVGASARRGAARARLVRRERERRNPFSTCGRRGCVCALLSLSLSPK